MYEEHFIDTNGIRLHTIVAGPENGKPVVLLHGFPEFWYGWRHQIEPLAKAGYRVIVPDQRGYNLSEKPNGVKQYRIDLLAQDIVGLLDSLGYTEVALVGHDWGGVVDGAKPGSFTAKDIARYREAWAQPGAVHATINWYRAAFRAIFRPTVGTSAPIQVPTLILWGEADWALSPWLARDSAAHCTQSTLRFFPGVGHWLQHDQPQEVTQAILDFLMDV